MGNTDEAKKDWVRASNRGHQQAKDWLSGQLEREKKRDTEHAKPAGPPPSRGDYEERGNDPKSKDRNEVNESSTGCGVAGFVVLILVVAMLAVASDFKSSSQPPETTADSSAQTTDTISPQLQKAQELSTNARLICEHQQVLDTLSQIDDSQANASQLAEKKRLTQKANTAIRELDAPGKDKYWEDCNVGVGFQIYDK